MGVFDGLPGARGSGISRRSRGSPVRPATRTDYIDRIRRVLRHVPLHLDDELRPEALADVAAFSRFHFHRVWTRPPGGDDRAFGLYWSEADELGQLHPQPTPDELRVFYDTASYDEYMGKAAENGGGSSSRGSVLAAVNAVGRIRPAALR